MAAVAGEEGKNQVYNVAVGGRTTLNSLADSIRLELGANDVNYTKSLQYRDFRVGDVRHSQADITKIKTLLGYAPDFSIAQGIEKAMPWYVQNETAG